MDYDLIIIGAGPAGYVAAIRSGQLGMKTLLIEKHKSGGMCLNWGCIPSKSLIESAKLFDKIKAAQKFGIDGIDKKKLEFNLPNAVKKAFATATKLSGGIDYLLKKNGVEIIKGVAEIVDGNSITVENRNISAKHIIIATGSLPEKSGNKKEIGIGEMYRLEKIPEEIVFAGHGPVSVELAQMAALTGSNVAVLTESELLIPDLDDYLNSFLRNKLKKEKIKIISSDDEVPDNAVIVNARLRTAVLPKSQVELKLDEKGFIETDEDFRTNIESIYAIGDVNGKYAYAHAASAQALHVINKINGVGESFQNDKIPINIYTYPEIGQIGMTEKQLKEEGIDYKINNFPLSANAKALISGDNEGEIRILSEKKYGEVLGIQIIAENATDMIAEASAYLAMEGTIYDIAATIHAHPTVSEIFFEAGFDAVHKAIHK